MLVAVRPRCWRCRHLGALIRVVVSRRRECGDRRALRRDVATAPSAVSSTRGPRSRVRDCARSSYSISSRVRCIRLASGIRAGCEGALRSHWKGFASALRRARRPWEQTVFFLPLGHSESLTHLEAAVTMARAIVQQVPAHPAAAFEHSASQARGHRDVVARFGHANASQRDSRPQPRRTHELAYLAKGELVHRRSLPAELACAGTIDSDPA